MSNPPNRANISLADFVFDQVRPGPVALETPTIDLGPLGAFVGDYAGNGFNTIFRPDNSVTPTPLPNPVPPSPLPLDNILELNLTSEVLSFSKSLGSVPNRGTTPQGDIFLNGVPYLQTISDVTIAGQSTGIHVEPGLWMIVPPTSVPAVSVPTFVRMASIPHGTTIEAQGIALSKAGPPIIDPVNITPFVTNSNPTKFITFPSQTATDPNTFRIPQDLSGFIAAGSITQALLDDPNSLLRAHISGQTIIATTAIIINTVQPAPPPPPPTPGLIGGGTDNIAFLLGQQPPPPAPPAPNAQAIQMTAIFWVESVEETILVPPYNVGQPPHSIPSANVVPGQRPAVFSVTPPFDLDTPRQIKVRFLQIQYTQTVFLNFHGLTWPHVSVNTLVPADEIVVPASAWA